MEHRNLIRFGSSSYVVSLPIKWLKRNNLNKGDIVYFEENGNGELVLSPEVKEEKKEIKEITIDIENRVLEDIRREIVSGYIAGYDVINAVGSNLEEVSKDIREILRNLTSFEIVEYTPKRIVAKNFLDIKEVSIENLVRRMDIIIRSMIEDSKRSIRESRYALLKDKDLDVNRLCFLALRVIKLSLNEPKIAERLKMNNTQLLSNWMLITFLEKIGDETRRISRFLSKIKLNKQEAKDLEELYSNIEEEYLNAMKSYYSDDRELAFNVASQKDKLINLCNDYFDKYNKGIIGSIIEKMKGMVIHIRNFVRVVYDVD